MAPVTTPAVVLHAFKYGETSKIVRLLTPDHGVMSAIAKGALQPRSRFGGRLQVLSGGVAQIYIRQTRDLQTLSAFDVTTQRASLADDVRRYASAAAVAELILRFAPQEPHHEIYDLVASLLDRLGTVAAENIELTAIASIWQVIGALGFTPSLGQCARCGGALPDGSARFSVADGGMLCARCGAGRRASVLGPEDRVTLAWLVAGAVDDVGAHGRAPLHDVGAPVQGRATAHRRLIARFVERHLNDGATETTTPLRALTFWETMSWNATS